MASGLHSSGLFSCHSSVDDDSFVHTRPFRPSANLFRSSWDGSTHGVSFLLAVSGEETKSTELEDVAFGRREPTQLRFGSKLDWEVNSSVKTKWKDWCSV